MQALQGRERVQGKAYIYCFNDVILLFKSIQVGGGVSKSPNLSFRTLWMVFLVLNHVRQVCVRDHVRRFMIIVKPCTFNKNSTLFIFFGDDLTLSPPVARSAGHNTQLNCNSNISEKVRVNGTFSGTFFEECSITLIMITRLPDFTLVVLQLLTFKVHKILEISKPKFVIFSIDDRVKTIFETEVCHR